MRRLVFALSAILLASPARAEWWVAETDHFTVYAEGKAKETELFTQRLERFAMAMRFMQNMPAKPKESAHRLTVFRSGDITDIARLYGDPRAPVAGFFIPRASGSVAFVPAREAIGRTPGTRDSGDGEMGSEIVLFHEYVHHFMMQYFPVAYPAWYIEGFAELYSTAEFLDQGMFRIGKPANHRGMQLFYDVHYPVKKLFEAKQKPADARHHYSVGWLLTHYLTFSPDRKGQLKTYLSAVSKGVASDEAARQSFGDLDQLDRDVQRYMTTRLVGYEVKPAGYVAPRVKLRALTVAETAVIESKMRSERGVNKKSAPGVAAQTRARAAPFPNDAFVQVALAEAEYDADNLDAAQAAADRALAANPSDTGALNYLGMIDMKRAEKDPSRYAAARAWFVKANRIEPNNPELLINNYLAFDRAGGAKVPELAIIGLERAFELAPFDHEVRFLLARQLLRENRGKAARSILTPVAFSAHGSNSKKAAEKVLASIDRNDLPGAIGVADKHVKSGNEEAKD